MALCLFRGHKKIDISKSLATSLTLIGSISKQSQMAQFSTVIIYMYQLELVAHCGVKYKDLVKIYPNRKGAVPIYCIVAFQSL
jgi:hypothetical protein